MGTKALIAEQYLQLTGVSRFADIAVDAHLDVDDVRASLGRLDGVKVVVGREAGTLSVLRVLPEDTPL